MTTASVVVLAALMALLTAGIVAARVDATVSESIAAFKDATIAEYDPDHNSGDDTRLTVDATRPNLDATSPADSGMAQVSLLRWDLSGIAPGTKVESASVTLDVMNASPKTFEVHTLKRRWTESDATWNVYASAEPWEVSGAEGTLDREPVPVGSITPSATGAQTFALSTEAVQRWVDNPGSNQGIVFDDSGNRDGFDFYSGESARRPLLNVELEDAATQDGLVLVGAGDISRCNNDNDEATAKLLDTIPGTVFTTGDNAYEDGSAEQFSRCYEPTWGRHKERTRPSVGNHEYRTADASGYFGYFGPAAGNLGEGYYSYDLGAWHIVVLNSECQFVGGCGPEDPQIHWLKQDLANNASSCTLAYWHTPVFSSGPYGGNERMKPAWEVLFSDGAEAILNGHAHMYERFRPMEPDGDSNYARGIREFVVGTGGASYYQIGEVHPNSLVRNADTYGVLKLTLHPNGYNWEFVPVAGDNFTDSGGQSCH